MENTSKKETPFLTTQKIYSRLWPVALAVLLLIILALVPLDRNAKSGIFLIILIFGGLSSIAELRKFSDSSKNIEYLKNNGYYEQMCAETPAQFTGPVHFTDTFVFSTNRLLCLPIDHIQSVRPLIVNYINSAAKSKIQLDVWMDNGDAYCLLLKSGSITEARKSMLNNCVLNLLMKNPQIMLRK